MSNNKALSVPAVIVNNETMKIIPGSLTYNGGEPAVNVRAVSAGGNNTTTVHGVDASTGVGMVKFTMATTPDMDGLIAEWKEQVAGNSIEFVERVGAENVKRSFRNMSLINEVERSTGPDGTIELEFKGDRMS